MKTFILGLTVLFASSFMNAPKQVVEGEECSYLVELINNNQMAGANYEWVWKVTNPCPGNGKDETTLQDLSHWSLVPGCVTSADIVGAAYSTDGTNWTSMSTGIAVDPSQSVYTAPVIKFDRGINGDVPVYFELIVNKVFYVGTTQGVFKSGRNTGTYMDYNVAGMTCSTGGGVENPR